MRVVAAATAATVALLISLASSSDSHEDTLLSPFENVTRSRIINGNVPSPKEVQELIVGKKDKFNENIEPVDSQKTVEIVPDEKGKGVFEGETEVTPTNLDPKSKVDKPRKKRSHTPRKVPRDRKRNELENMNDESSKGKFLQTIEKKDRKGDIVSKRTKRNKKNKKDRRKGGIVTRKPITLTGCAKPTTLKVFVAVGLTLLLIGGVTYVLDPTHTVSMWISETASSLLQSLPSLETISGWVGSLFSSTKISPQLIEEVYVCNPGRCMKYSVCVEAIKQAIKEGGTSCYKAAECVSAIINTAGSSCYQNLISGSGPTCDPRVYVSGNLGV